ncbi:non-hydrolyzing UDP-N-acetylglucosamine 2-epimerase [Dietzia maris]|uniref:non-hydrolyzing UDP-N-acetylglucosamine 2-epimerase n=1 Tax=Dietzia maris TaxID=37915 RepID=UPI0021AF4E63|nr:UDP-N-acetylglucosamine 2-epimerase (non-hydrolyzing) [Dietzia maris]MCT1434815.1 UDP-N-acetylglucosamine 2-epimerase (non-hydrolyzing) [Dietzia maris]MCT1522774.1 UDP-N-acetylglucosamine 2-epimerase (non-hydrolyzing) [Dietzia maris]
MHKIATVYGTRPEAIKVAPLVKRLESEPRFAHTLISTGQHTEMLEQVNELFGMSPDFELDVFSAGQSLNGLVSKVTNSLDQVLTKVSPDAIVVQGDTSTVTAAALAAFNLKVPVIHLEAGLRSGNLFSPFPEEANRRIVSQVASLHLCPTSTARRNLLDSGIQSSDIFVTGNTVIDALHQAVTIDAPPSVHVAEALTARNQCALVTLHRRENWPQMTEIAQAIADIALRFPDRTFILPLHANPRVRAPLIAALSSLPNVFLTDSIDYRDMVAVLQRCDFVITDSGGLQEEAPSLGKPVFVVRDDTERPEAVLAGTVMLVGTSRHSVTRGVLEIVEDPARLEVMRGATNPYGDGHAAQRCVAAIANMLGSGVPVEEFQPEGV